MVQRAKKVKLFQRFSIADIPFCFWYVIHAAFVASITKQNANKKECCSQLLEKKGQRGKKEVHRHTKHCMHIVNACIWYL